jgi:hypothetical protein
VSADRLDANPEVITDGCERLVDLCDDRDEVQRAPLREFPFATNQEFRCDELPDDRPVQLRLDLDQFNRRCAGQISEERSFSVAADAIVEVGEADRIEAPGRPA